MTTKAKTKIVVHRIYESPADMRVEADSVADADKKFLVVGEKTTKNRTKGSVAVLPTGKTKLFMKYETRAGRILLPPRRSGRSLGAGMVRSGQRQHIT
jgi:hypothetical protein